jgi:predicted anti-sigma-YlaC factor YlaD
MQITHEQAQKLIQLHMDQALNSQESAVLSAHLRDCRDCQTYANEVSEVKRLLPSLLKKQWARTPAPLSIKALAEKKLKRQSSINLLTTRTAAIGFVVIALFFSVWQFASSGSAVSNPLPLMAPPVPTPLTQTALSIDTTMTLENCKLVLYIVQGNDTLAGIADQFSVPEEEILAANSLEAKAVRPAMELVVPICNFTPTGTVHPATFTTTYTPIIQLNTSTPEG